jgi:hypothetical protein
MSKLIARLLPLLLLFGFHLHSVNAQQANQPPSLALGDAVVTGFSGTTAPGSTKPSPAIDLTFINPDGPSARIIGLGQPRFVWDGRVFAAPKTFDVLAKDVGQVFGVALDDRAAPDVYLAATSAFGLQIVGPGAGGQLQRRKIGGPAAGWMEGQFGLHLQGDPGSIYKVDGTTGVVTLFAKVMLNGVPNPGPALGNLAYDAAHKQLFVSDLYTGMIHRFAIADGSEGGPPYDHGVTGRGAAHLPPVPFDPANRPNIASTKFDSENPNTWGFAPPERRMWGLTVHDGRLFYSVRNGAATQGPQIWSIGIQQDGSFAADAQQELDVPAQPGPYPVSDIAFAQDGAMILAQRAPIAASYDYSAFTKTGEPRVLRYSPAKPNDPNAPSGWVAAPGEYAVGFPNDYRNSNGGVDLGYGYDHDGHIDTKSCESAIWITGENLRDDPALRDRLAPGGPLVVHGIQGSDSHGVRDTNAPPWASYFVAYDDKFNNPRAHGHLGIVRINRVACGGGPVVVSGGPAGPSAAAGGGGGGAGGGGGGSGGACVCPAPMVAGATPGRCVCPQGTVLQNNACVTPTCPRPLVASAVPGVCVCERHGGACPCPAPLVAGPNAGECVWPNQSMACAAQACPPPKVVNPATGECVSPGGSLIVKKTITSPTDYVPPAGTITVQVSATCSPPVNTYGPYAVVNGGSYTINNIPLGDTCTVTENTSSPPSLPANACPPNETAVWSAPTYIPSTVVISGTPVTVTINNTWTCKTQTPTEGSLIVKKTVTGPGPVVPPGLSFPMNVSCTMPPPPPPFNLTNGGSYTVNNIAKGATCTVKEGSLPALPPNACPSGETASWAAPTYSPPSVVISGTPATITVNNTFFCASPVERPNVCPPPMVPGAAPGTCVCPEGTVQRGKECVPRPHPIECARPLMPNAAGTACVCPDDMVRKGRECVHPVVKCSRGMVRVDGRCVRRERNKPPEREKPGRNPNGPTGFGFPGRGGGGSGGGSGGGGARR